MDYEKEIQQLKKKLLSTNNSFMKCLRPSFHLL